MTTLVPILAGCSALFLLFAGLLAYLRATRTHKVNPDVRALGTDDVPSVLGTVIAQVGSALGQLGFDPAGLAEVNVGSQPRSYVALFSHAGTQDTAILEVRRRDIVRSRDADSVPSTFSFMTLWAVERAVITTNATDIHPFGVIRGHHILSLPGVKDLARLHVVHRSRAQAGMPTDGEMPRGGRRLDMHHMLLRRWGEVQVMRLNFSRADGAEIYRLTWRGARRLVIGALPWVRASRRRHLTQRRGAAGGKDRNADFQVAQTARV